MTSAERIADIKDRAAVSERSGFIVGDRLGDIKWLLDRVEKMGTIVAISRALIDCPMGPGTTDEMMDGILELSRALVALDAEENGNEAPSGPEAG